MSLLHRKKSNSCLQKPLAHSRARHSGASGNLSPVNKQETSLTGFQGAKNRFHLAPGQAAAPKVLNPFPSNLPPSPWQLERGLIRPPQVPGSGRRRPRRAYWPFKRLRPARPQSVLIGPESGRAQPNLMHRPQPFLATSHAAQPLPQPIAGRRADLHLHGHAPRKGRTQSDR